MDYYSKRQYNESTQKKCFELEVNEQAFGVQSESQASASSDAWILSPSTLVAQTTTLLEDLLQKY
jgi:hypothetical protein